MLFPKKHYAFHLPITAVDAQNLLEVVTHKGQLLPEKYLKGDELSDLVKFNGRIKNLRFEVSQKVKHGQHFIPLIKGEFVDAGGGCIVNVYFELFFGSKVLFLLWNLVSLLLAAVFTLKGNIEYGIIAFVFFVLNNLVAFFNFSMHVKKCKTILEEVFNI